MSEPLPAQLRRHLSPGAGTIIPGAPDALTARIVEATGFPLVYVTGAGISNAYLGAPDLGLTTATEVAAHVAAIREAVAIPIIVDADTGFGNALNLQRTVRAFERAGANALQFEDQVFPKRCGHFENKAVVPVQEMVQKIRAATDARREADFMILARTDARAVEGLDAAVDRMNAYREAGADLLFIEAPRTEEELRRIPQEVPGIHIANIVFGGKTPMLPADTLGRMGFAGILYANAALQASMLAMKRTLTHLRGHGSLAGAEDQLVHFDERQVFVDYERWTEMEKRYTGG
jgi:2-methylisocitrate lyase-like PEP mutase family enzyme